MAVEAIRSASLVIILGGGSTVGLKRNLKKGIPVPVLDSVSCAVQISEALVKIGLTFPEERSFFHSNPKPIKGLSPVLTQYFDVL